MAALGSVGVGALLTGSATAEGCSCANGGSPHTWNADVDAGGNALTNLGSLSTAANATGITDFAGQNLSIDDEGALNAREEIPDSIHIATDYPGETLDEKINNILEEVPSADPFLPPGQPGHRIVVPAPDPSDPAALDGPEGEETPIWRWENPVVFENNRGKIVLDMGWTLIFATAEFESFFVIGPDEKTENITINGGFLYARDNLQRSFIRVGNAGHCHFEEQYLQSLEGTTPMGIEFESGTELNVTGVEVTGCTNSLVARNVVDLDVINHRGGGGENSVVLDGCRGANVHSVHTGSTEPQSVRNDVVRLENGVGPNLNVTITAIRSVLQAFDHHAGVSAVDVTDGEGEKHRNVNIYSVNATGAEYGTDLQWVEDYDQQAITPEPSTAASSGVTRHFADGVQSFDTADAHEFGVGNETTFTIGEDDVEVAGGGNGVVLTTPDGEQRYRLRVDDCGCLVTEKVGSDE